jgi:hypothetical protein
MGIKCLNLGFNACGSKTFIVIGATSIEQY